MTLIDKQWHWATRCLFTKTEHTVDQGRRKIMTAHKPRSSVTPSCGCMTTWNLIHQWVKLCSHYCKKPVGAPPPLLRLRFPQAQSKSLVLSIMWTQVGGFSPGPVDLLEANKQVLTLLGFHRQLLLLISVMRWERGQQHVWWSFEAWVSTPFT